MKEFLKEGYKAYIASYEWKKKRQEAFLEYGHACQRCKKETDLVIHHKTYVRFTAEKLSDLAVLCYQCHEEYHSLTKRITVESTDRYIRTGKVIPKDLKKRKETYKSTKTIPLNVFRGGRLITLKNMKHLERQALKEQEEEDY